MSERNRYMRTNLKSTPFKQSSKKATQTGISSKRLNMSTVYFGTKKAVGEADVLLINNTHITKESSMSRHTILRDTRPVHVIQKISDKKGEHVPRANRAANTNINRNAKSYLENNKPYLHKEQKSKSDKQMTQIVTNKNKINETQDNNTSRDSKFTCLGKTQTPNTILDNKENGKPIRPKSARPESRWERRFDDDVDSDEECIQIRGKTPRPKSARPDSRTVRLLNQNSQKESESDNSYSSDLTDIPPRPKTGHGRRRSSITNSEDDIWSSMEINIDEIPKSRLGNISNHKNNKVQEGKHISNNFLSLTSDLSTDNATVANNYEFTSTTCNKNKNVISTQPQNDTSSRQVREINYGVDDIDSNVDPVLYFLQEDNVPLTRSIKKPSLSKDTIGCIGNTKASLQSNANIGCYRDYQNKSNAFTENSSRNHRNRLLSPQDTVQGKNISLQNGYDRLAKSKTSGNYFRAKPCGNYVKAVKDPDLLLMSQSSKGSVSDYRSHGGYRQMSNNTYSKGVIQDTSINDEKVNRKPRKL